MNTRKMGMGLPVFAFVILVCRMLDGYLYYYGKFGVSLFVLGFDHTVYPRARCDTRAGSVRLHFWRGPNPHTNR